MTRTKRTKPVPNGLLDEHRQLASRDGHAGTVATHDFSPRGERIVENLETIFFNEGFLHLSTDELARRLRCSKQTLYSIAPSREALFELIIERFLARLREEGERVVEHAPDWVSAVTGYLDVAVRFSRSASAKWVTDLAHFTPGRRRLARHQRQRITGLARLVAAGMRDGAFDDAVSPQLMAAVLLHAAAMMFDPDFLASCGLSLSQAYAELYHWFINGLMPRSGTSKTRKAPKVNRKELHRRMNLTSAEGVASGFWLPRPL